MMQDLPAFLAERVAQICAPRAELRVQALNHLNQLTKPLGSLGRLESIAEQLVAIFGGSIPLRLNKAAYIFAADHGVCSEGVSLYPPEVTAQMVHNFAGGGAAINVLCRLHDCALTVVDAGVDADLSSLTEVEHRKVRRGSRNLAKEPAMTDAELAGALRVGTDLADLASARNQHLVAVGEMGIGNTTAASAITALLTGRPAGEVTGSGTGLDEDARLRKAKVVQDAIAAHFGNGTRSISPVAILQCAGGLEIAAMTGFYLAATAHGIALVCDGFISTAAAAIAAGIAPSIRHNLFAGHRSEEPGHRWLLEKLELEPILELHMRLGEGSGAVLAMPVIESAAAIYREMATFSSAGVSEAPGVSERQ
jgi:nicotinate-nucleotide--dimethylbenzimidazole phosphoribosyltransferase